MTAKTMLAASALLATTALLWFTLQSAGEADVITHSYPAFQQEILRDNVRSITISPDSEATGKLKSGQTFTVILPQDDPSIYDLLGAHNVAVEIRASTPPAWLPMALLFFPILVHAASWLLAGFVLGVGFYWGVRWSRRFMTGSTTGGL